MLRRPQRRRLRRNDLQFGKASDDCRGLNDGRVSRRKRQESINHSLKFLPIADHDLRQKTIFSDDAIRFDDLRRVDEHLRQSFYFTGHGAHSDMSGDAEAEDFGIDLNRMPPNRALVFQLVNPLCYAGAGQANLGVEQGIFV